MHIVSVTLNNSKTKESVTTHYEFYSIYNAERFVFEEEDINVVRWPYSKRVSLKGA